MRYVISYDIVDDRRRNKVAEHLKDIGIRVQYSVFECDLQSGEVAKLQHALSCLIDEQVDNVRLYRICAKCTSKIAVIGQGQWLVKEPVLVI